MLHHFPHTAQPAPAAPELRLVHHRGMFGCCHSISAYVGFESIGGASCDPSRGHWVISVGDVELEYQNRPQLTGDKNLAAIDAIITNEFLRGVSVSKSRKAALQAGRAS